MNNLKITIINGDKIYTPVIKDGVTYESVLNNGASKLEFTVHKDDVVSFFEGNIVTAVYNDEKVFYGYIFSKSRSDKDFIKVVAFDQMVYLRNKDTINIINKKASDVLVEFASKFGLTTGVVEDTGVVISSLLIENKPIFDIVLEALEYTTNYSECIYTIYDDFGKLCLKEIKNRGVDFVLSEKNSCKYSYKSNIKETYNHIVVMDGTQVVAEEVDTTNVEKWGVLRFVEKYDEDMNSGAKARELLKKHNKVFRTLEFSDVLGNVKVRGGSSIFVQFNLGDVAINEKMTVINAKHTFKSNGDYFMSLKVKGGVFSE